MGYATGQKLAASELNDPTPTGDITLGDDIFLASGGQLLWNGDTNLYRLQADHLKSDDRIVSAAGSQVAMPYAHLYATALVALTANTARSLPMGAELVDNINGHDNASNNTRYTPSIAGYYECKGHLAVVGATAADILCEFRKNGAILLGASYSYQRATNQGFASNTCDCTATIFLNGTTDYVELWATSSLTINTDVPSNDSNSNWTIGWKTP